jgi:nucleotide-binding universal stress UspA family protein
MFRKVLVSMDLSPATEALVSALPALRDLGTEELILVHTAKPLQEPVSASLRQVEDIRARLNGLADRLQEQGFSTAVTVANGSPAVEIVRAAESLNPDVILVGTRSHSRVREAFIGSVAWEVVRRAKRPVLLQRIEANRPDPEAALESRGSGLPKHVIYPTDFSEMAAAAIPWLEDFARKGVPLFTVTHVLPIDGESGRQGTEAQLEELADRLRAAGAPEVRTQVRTGTPHEEIISAGAKSADALVVMGTHGKGFLPEIVLGSVSRQLVRHASSRVLLVPSSKTET